MDDLVTTMLAAVDTVRDAVNLIVDMRGELIRDLEAMNTAMMAALKAAHHNAECAARSIAL